MTKYGNKKVVVDGIKFDSKLECDYYLKLKRDKDLGLIKDFELQPKFLLQPKFKKNNKSYRAITYTADFKVFYNDGSVEIIDIKGMKTTEFKLKEKMFEYNFPNLSLKCLSYVKKYGEWIDFDELTKIRRNNRRK